MSNLFDKSIHRDEFRLRILMTDGCNKNCSFCLNDFMKKPEDKPQFLELNDAWKAITSYCGFMHDKKQLPIITFSGGEPGIHPRIHSIIHIARKYGALVKVVTNGTALYLTQLRDLVDCWHVSVTRQNKDLIEFLEANPGYNVQIQHVVTKNCLPQDLYDLVVFYGSRGFPLKLWVDFFDSNEEKKKSQDLIEYTATIFPQFEIKSRFTGKQENRGVGCIRCGSDCVTLKALWVFPDGTGFFCPQHKYGAGKERKTPVNWYSLVQETYDLHKTE